MPMAIVMMAAMHRVRICAGREMSRVQFPEQPHKVWQALASDDDMGRAEPALGSDRNARAWPATVIGNGARATRNDVGGCNLQGRGAFALGHPACGKCVRATAEKQ